MGLGQTVEQGWMNVATRIGALAALEARARESRRAHILCYHGVRPAIDDAFDPNGAMHVTPELFEAHVAYLTRTHEVVPVDRIVSGATTTRDGRPLVAITFDDGYRDNADHAFPILKRYDCPATIFLPTAFVDTGRAFWWEQLEHWIRTSRAIVEMDGIAFDTATTDGKARLFEHLRRRLTRAGPVERDLELERVRALLDGTRDVHPSTMSWARIRELAATGLVTFGAHTVNHVAMSSVSDAELEDEVARSGDEVRRRIPGASGIFAYPYGRHADLDPRAARVLARHGFTGAVTLLAAAVRPDGDPYALPRIFVARGDTVERLRAKLAGLDAPFWLGRRLLHAWRQRRLAPVAR